MISKSKLWEAGLNLGVQQVMSPFGVPKSLVDIILEGEVETAITGSVAVCAGESVRLVSVRPALAVMHYNVTDLERPTHLEEPHIGRRRAPVTVNYHHASSEGNFKLFYQDTSERERSYVCEGAFLGLKSAHATTFYAREISWPDEPGRFHEDVQNPLKIDEVYIAFAGNALAGAVKHEWETRGFVFDDSTGPGTEESILYAGMVSETGGTRKWPPK